MIKNNVPQLLAVKFADRRVNLSQVQQDTGLTYATIHRWAHNRVDRADFPVLEIWCKYFGCTVGEILVFEA